MGIKSYNQMSFSISDIALLTLIVEFFFFFKIFFLTSTGEPPGHSWGGPRGPRISQEGGLPVIRSVLAICFTISADGLGASRCARFAR